MKPTRVAAASGRAALAGLVAAPLLSGCQVVSGSEGTRVAAAFYPLEYVASRVAGPHAEVVPLTTPGQEPHDLELTVRQTAEVAGADVVLYSRGLQPAVDAAVSQAAEGTPVDATGPADLVPLSEEHRHERENHPESGAGDELDPHFWLDPTRLSSVAIVFEKALADADPQHAGAYAANLADLERDLDALDEDLSSGLAHCRRHTIVVSHDAFGYLAARYGLDVHAINGLSPAAEPSPAHVQELAELIRSEGITTVFSETLASPEMADVLAHDLGLKTAVLDPIEGLTDATADEDYLSLMRADLAAIRKADDCS